MCLFQYVNVWEGLREEFEVEPRFNNLKYKLNLIQDNTKVLHFAAWARIWFCSSVPHGRTHKPPSRTHAHLSIVLSQFFLEIMHNQKSNMLEWVIIVLISAEIVVCSMDLCDIKPTWIINAIEMLVR